MGKDTTFMKRVANQNPTLPYYQSSRSLKEFAILLPMERCFYFVVSHIIPIWIHLFHFVLIYWHNIHETVSKKLLKQCPIDIYIETYIVAFWCDVLISEASKTHTCVAFAASICLWPRDCRDGTLSNSERGLSCFRRRSCYPSIWPRHCIYSWNELPKLSVGSTSLLTIKHNL